MSARAEHGFSVVKKLWRFSKAPYRGLCKNATRTFVAMAMANIYLARKSLLIQVRAQHSQIGRIPRLESRNRLFQM